MHNNLLGSLPTILRPNNHYYELNNH